ncbi:Stk1 family PASTA domain-containing Ser/Thr kinase [Rarobacter incanus]|uniref:non-specific serine/threonine protein kinase n=1 Tax=Rarobacter incanus TaxID=153494 RepID=A0A542SMS8_9MICO|nr:Stk1 family PASTA domain-containing Ser/Thr kinase [Rarobacter incanus]TQK75795.1 serine/threonine-protein kinase [Rarobacter incanus]
MTLSAGDRLVDTTIDGRYRIRRRLASGGMATVYLATDLRLDRDVAVKVMHEHLAHGPHGSDFAARFRREARSAARLAHPHLVAVHDQGVDADVSYLVMEYVSGPNLRRLLVAEPPMTVRDALRIIREALDALAAVHAAGLVHRDIKPENILLTPTGSVKVADFGLARAVTEVTAASTGTVMGTVAYLSPELITSGKADARTDVYAIGATLFEMLTGHQLFEGDTPIQIALQHLQSEAPRPSEISPWLPSEIDDFVAQMTTRDPDNRIPSAGVALAAIKRVESVLSEGVLAHTVTPPPATGDAANTIETSRDGQLSAEDHDPDRDSKDAVEGSGDEQGRESAHTVSLHIQPTQAAPVVRSAPHDRPARTPRRRRRPLLVLTIMLALALAGTVGASVWYQTLGPGAYTSVPEQLVGQTIDDATAALTAASLVADQETAYSDTIPNGLIVSTDPESAERVRRGTTVTLVISQGVEYRDVPDEIVGKKLAEVQDAITSAGFPAPTVEREFSDTVDKGVIIASSVPQGSRHPHNTTITLTVSKGKEPVEVPNLAQMTTTEAESVLANRGLNLKVGKKQYDDSIPEGAIVSQVPAAGSQSYRTATVTVVTSRGPKPVEVPNVVGMSESDATTTLKDAGFEVKADRYLGAILDRVRFQSEDAGTKIPPGTTITITVW